MALTDNSSANDHNLLLGQLIASRPNDFRQTILVGWAKYLFEDLYILSKPGFIVPIAGMVDTFK